MEYNFYDRDSLVDRLAHATKKQKKVVFLFGAPVSAPRCEHLGVPDVNGVVELVMEFFSKDALAKKELERALEKASDTAYQAAISFLLGRRGQDAVNELIKKAVSFSIKSPEHDLNSILDAKDEDLLAIEQDSSLWGIPNALLDLGKLSIKYPSVFGKVQLTTNFDPLLSVAINSLGGSSYRTILARDGSLAQTQGYGCHIIHLHGYWFGSDTLHIPQQLTQSRPKLKSSIAELFRNSIIVPIAYSGWDDIFTRTLIEVLSDNEINPEILWTYYQNNEADIVSQFSNQLNMLNEGISSGRLVLYKGVDCHSVFSDIYAKAAAISELDGNFLSDDGKIEPECNYIVDEIFGGDSSSVCEDASIVDPIPHISKLIGRDAEIDNLLDGQNKIVAICGIGGQGKTSLAAYHALKCKEIDNYSFVDWRDCREQNDTLHTVLTKSLVSISDINLKLSDLKDVPSEMICKRLTKHLSEKRGMLVLDNVDHYIDLASGEPIGLLKTLVDNILDSKLSSQVILTARPQVTIESPDACLINLKGLSRQGVKELFEEKSQSNLNCSDFERLFFITDGHPLWILLIAARCRHERTSIKVVLDDIELGRGELPERTILSIWNRLNDKQKIVLRTLAEMERPLSEEEVSTIDFEINYNQFKKGLKVLKALSLVESKYESGGEELLDLHPLIRQYIRKNYPQPERERFITKIILVIDRKLNKFLGVFGGNDVFPANMIDIWAHKVDLHINTGKLDSAIQSLLELHYSLISSGQSEEFIRLSSRIFDKIDWVLTCSTLPKFHSLWSKAVKSFIEEGLFERADELLSKYADSIEGKGANFINYCDAMCYRFWFVNDFEQAIYYGEKGVELANKSNNVDTGFDCSHNLALAWRDKGRTDEALKYFMGQEIESSVLSPDVIDEHRGGAFYGNIGRCYYLGGDIDKAVVCYKKSAKLLESDKQNRINCGYIRQWVGEVSAKLGAFEDSVIFYRAAFESWKGFVPGRANTIESDLQSLLDEHPYTMRVMDFPLWRIENRFSQWIAS